VFWWIKLMGVVKFAGIMFQDITTLLLDHKAFKDTVDIFVDRYRDMHISVVAGTVLYSSITFSSTLSATILKKKKHFFFLYPLVASRAETFFLELKFQNVKLKFYGVVVLAPRFLLSFAE